MNSVGEVVLLCCESVDCQCRDNAVVRTVGVVVLFVKETPLVEQSIGGAKCPRREFCRRVRAKCRCRKLVAAYSVHCLCSDLQVADVCDK